MCPLGNDRQRHQCWNCTGTLGNEREQPQTMSADHGADLLGSPFPKVAHCGRNESRNEALFAQRMIMGIYDREYYRREGPSFLSTFAAHGKICKWLVGINVVVFVLQI